MPDAMSLVRSTACIAVAVLVVSVVGACEETGSSDIGQTEEGTIRLGSVEAVDTVSRAVAPNDRPLVLNSFRGSVHLTGDEGETAELTFLRRGRGEDVEAARSVLNDISLTEEGTADAYTFTLEAEGEAYAAVDIRGTVPRPTALQIEQLSGPVRLEGIEGALTIRHEQGAVEVFGAAAPVEVDIQNGDVQVEFQRVPPNATISLRTDNGSIHVGLPPDASVHLDARTNVGAIRIGDLVLSDERFTPLNAGGRYNAEMGDGEASVELRTENGSITVQSADTSQQGPKPPPDTIPVPPSDTVVAQPPPDTADTVSTERPDRRDTLEADTVNTENR